MTWSETRRRCAALTDAEAAVARDPSALPWCEEYAEVFGDRASLLAALRHRWNVRLQAQLDPELGSAAVAATRGRLYAEHAGLVSLLRRPSSTLLEENYLVAAS